MVLPLGSPDPILLSLQLQVLPPAGDGDHPEVIPVVPYPSGYGYSRRGAQILFMFSIKDPTFVISNFDSKPQRQPLL